MNQIKPLILLFISLLILWNIFTPLLEGADESGHFCQADYIAHRNKLPNLKIIDGCFLWHPPLYYLSLVPAINFFGLEEFNNNYFESNPKFNLLRKGEYAQFVHTKNELFLKWDRKIILVHTERLFSSIFAIIIFVLTWNLSNKLFKDKFSRISSLILFFNPMFLHIFTTLTNVTLLSLLTSIIIFLDLSFLNKRRSLKYYGLMGLLFGLGYLTKNSIVNILPPMFIAFLMNTKNIGYKKSHVLLNILIFISSFLITAGWYVYRSFKLYGTIFEFEVLKTLPGDHYHETLLQKVGFFNYINSLFLTIFRTFWSGYGALTINFPSFINVIILVIVLFVMVIIIQNIKKMNLTLKICCLYTFSAFVLLFLENFTFAAMHAKDLFIAYMPLTLLAGYSVSKISKIEDYLKSKYEKMLILTIAIYFFAQSEIVKVIKIVINLTVNYLFVQDIYLILIKAIYCVIVFYSLIYIFKKLEVGISKFKKLFLALFYINVFIISICIYLFYFKFIPL